MSTTNRPYRVYHPSTGDLYARTCTEEEAVTMVHRLDETGKAACFDDIRFSHVQRMQARIMAADSQVTWGEWLAESEQERANYYRWLCQQAGEHADLF